MAISRRVSPAASAARFYVQVRRQSDNGKFYGPFYAKSKAIKFANEHEVASDDLEAKRETTIYTHTQMVKKFGCGFENYPWKYLEA